MMKMSQELFAEEIGENGLPTELDEVQRAAFDAAMLLKDLVRLEGKMIAALLGEPSMERRRLVEEMLPVHGAVEALMDLECPAELLLQAGLALEAQDAELGERVERAAMSRMQMWMGALPQG